MQNIYRRATLWWTHRNGASSHGLLRGEPSVAEGRQEEAGVGDHQHYRVGRAAARVRAGHLRFDRQSHEIREEDQEATLFWFGSQSRVSVGGKRWRDEGEKQEVGAPLEARGWRGVGQSGSKIQQRFDKGTLRRVIKLGTLALDYPATTTPVTVALPSRHRLG